MKRIPLIPYQGSVLRLLYLEYHTHNFFTHSRSALEPDGISTIIEVRGRLSIERKTEDHSWETAVDGSCQLSDIRLHEINTMTWWNCPYNCEWLQYLWVRQYHQWKAPQEKWRIINSLRLFGKDLLSKKPGRNEILVLCSPLRDMAAVSRIVEWSPHSMGENGGIGADKMSHWVSSE